MPLILALCITTMTDEELIEIGIDIEALLRNRSFESIAAKYGYALSFDLEPSEAIRKDFISSESECVGCFEDAEVEIKVSHFSHNDTGLISEISCDFKLKNQTGILVELILGSKGNVYLEQISSYRLNCNA